MVALTPDAVAGDGACMIAPSPRCPAPFCGLLLALCLQGACGDGAPGEPSASATGGDGGADDTAEAAHDDKDADGFPASEDCDDTDPEVTPARFEAADGTVTDISERLESSRGLPRAVLLDEPGVLTLCPGTWRVAIDVAADIEIGSWADGVVLSGGGQATVVTLQQDWLSLTLRDLEISNGQADVAGGTLGYLVGGGLRCQGVSAVELIGVTLRDNSAEIGGGIYADGRCDVTLVDSTIADNVASYSGGGAALDDAKLRLEDSEVSGNDSFYVGGILATDTLVTMEGGELRHNTSSHATAGMNVGGRMVTLTDVTVTGNVGALTGGIRAYYTTLSLDRCTFTDNVAEYGSTASELSGGGALDLFASEATLTDTRLVGNWSNRDAGALLTDYLSTVDIVDATFEDNYAGDDGGAIAVGAQVELTVTGSRFEGNSADWGGGIYAAETFGDVVLSTTVFADNDALYGGALYVDGPDVALYDLELQGNTATYDGGGVYLGRNATLDVDGMQITDGTAGVAGGGLYLGINSSFHGLGLDLSDNSPQGVYHASLGALDVSSGGSLSCSADVCE